MKKTILLLCSCVWLISCNSNSSSTTKESAPASSITEPAQGKDNSPAGQAVALEDGATLIAQSDCSACHSIDQKLVGPAYEAVAQKYENNAESTQYLAGKIMEGSSGVWGQISMPAHPDLSQEQAQAMATYILSLKK